MDLDAVLVARLMVVLALLDVPDLAAMMRFLAAGDLSGFPPHVAARFKKQLDAQMRLTNGKDEEPEPPLDPRPLRRRRAEH